MCRPHWIIWPTLLLTAFAPPSAGVKAAEEQGTTVELARDKRAQLGIMIGPQASASTKATANELARYLERISGAEFAVQSGDGGRGIVIGRPSDFPSLPFKVHFDAGPFDREEYLLRSLPEGLYLLGASDLAVSHAAWDLLHRLGHRQFFPGQTWEVIPSVAHLKIAVNDRQRPAFFARRIWYNWGLWGYNDHPYREWCIRNRMAKGFNLNSGHSYEGIIAANRAEFEKHPEYYAQVDGQRKPRPDAKFCASNPGLRQLVVDHAVRHFKQHPQADSISMDPSDGDGWCECQGCARLGSVSDRAVTLANEVAQAINSLGLGAKYVGMYAYNRHSSPPQVQVHPNVIPSATTAFIGGGLAFDQVLRGWQARGATMGVYDYLSVVDWDWNLPRGGSASRPARLARFLAQIHRQGVRFYDAESGDCWGPCGLGYYFASRVLWDIEEADRLKPIVEDFLDKAFGSAKEPMRAFYRLITEDTQRRSPSDLVGRMYRHLDAARRATTDARVLARIDDLVLYTRHAELYYAYANGSGSVEDVARHAYRMRRTMMVHSYGLWCRLISQKAALTEDHPLKDNLPFGPEELASILAGGIVRNTPVDPGFDGIAFSGNLIPAAERLKLPKVSPGAFPTHPQDRQRYLIWVPERAGAIDLRITVQKVWANRMPRISLYSPKEVTLNAVATDDGYKPDGKTYSIRLRTPHDGLHRVEAIDGGDYTRIEWPAGTPVTIESGIETSDVTSHFRGSWTMYFYVPRGTKIVGGWASRVANWAPRLSGKMRDGDGREVLDFSKSEDGWFKVPVPASQAGRLWKFENSQGQRLLMTVPPYLARSADELLLPSEVVERDARP